MCHAPQRRFERILGIAAAVALAASLLGGASSGAALANSAARASAGSGVANRFDPRSLGPATVHPRSVSGPKVVTPAPPGDLGRPAYPVPMRPGSLTLHADAAGRFLGSDGALEVDAPAGAVSSADLAAAADGSLSLDVSQVLPGSGSSAGGSGLVSLGTYLLQLVDGSGRPAAHGVRRPVTLTYHAEHAGGAANLAHAFVTFNGGLPAGSPAVAQAGGTLGGFSTKVATLDPATQTISVQAQLTTASTTASFNSNSPVASFGSPDPVGVGLSSGALTFDQPIDVPPGPGGLKPPISLSYSSESVAEQHSWQGAAGWVGEGWNLSLGSVTWSEENVSSATNSSGADWRSTWQLADPFGTASELIPPTNGVATYFDDTGHEYFDGDDSTTPYPNQPVQFHTADESQARVYSYVNPDTNADLPDDGGGARPACFRAYLPNGIMEEFGCTPTSVASDAPGGVPDSLQFYYSSGAQKDYISGWFLDMITDPQGNQIHITYQHHTHHFTSGANEYVRDMVPATIEWDSPACHDATNYCTGAAWQPLMRVSFAASQSVTRTTNSASGCNTSDIHLRCDDPKDLTSSGGLPAPEVVNTFALNDLNVQVRSSGAAGWSTLTDYQFSYEINGPGQLTDPVSGLSLSYAGYFDLTQLRVVGDDGTTALPTRTFNYTNLLQHYLDDAFSAKPSGNCGWAWNGDHGCHVWNHSRDGNDRYLSSISNGLGLAQSFTWAEARNNTHGVPAGSVLTDPLACDGQEETSPCFKADDRNFSHIVLTSETASIVQAAPTGNQPLSSTTAYTYRLTPLTAQPCSDCTVGMRWGSQNDTDELDFYNARFMGFAQATVTKPDNSVDVHLFHSTAGIGLYDTSQVGCDTSSPCHDDPWWSPANALHGREAEVDSYDTDGATLLKQVRTQYQLTCPPAGVTASPPSNFGNWDGNRVGDVEHSNPSAVCDIQTSEVDTYTFDGASSALAVPHRTVTYAYDQFDRVTAETTTVNDGGVTGSPTTLVQRTDHVWNDALTPIVYGVTGTYLVDVDADRFTADAAGTVHTACAYTGYDGQPFATGQQSALTMGEATTSDRYAACGTSGNGFALAGLIRTTAAYDRSGNKVGTTDADANAGVAGHTGCVAGSATYSACTTYDGTFAALPVAAANALNQATTTRYTPSTAGGFGIWPTSTTDPNGQTTSTAYDPLGRVTGVTRPGETSGLTTTASSYTVWCSGTAAQMPCGEVDTTQRVDSSTTVTGRAFYDGMGRLAETRRAAPAGRDVVQYALYDRSGRRVFLSIPYFVTAYTAEPGAAAFSAPDLSQPGTSTTYTNLRSTTVTDALSDATTTSASVACSVVATDSACYAATTTVDPLAHQQVTFADAMNRKAYARTFTGSSGSTYSVYATTATTYDLQRNSIRVVHPDGSSATTSVYDDAGRTTASSDPDAGAASVTYDPNGSPTESVDARGGAGTVFIGYDGLNRPIWHNSSSGPSGAYVTFSYDSTAGGSAGIGRLTGETFSGAGLSGSQSFIYDGRGQLNLTTLTVGSTSYTMQVTYDDAGQIQTQSYPDGEVVTTSRGAGNWLTGVSTQQGGTTTPLLTGAGYAGPGGAAGNITSGSFANGLYGYTAGYDLLARPTDEKLTLARTGTTLFETQPVYDAAGNVSGVTTSLPTGTDAQVFCYDEQNRLVWAGSTGTPSCSGTAIASGTLTAASYTQTFGYDTLDRLTSGPLGTYVYGDAAHLDAATAIGTGYSASYDAAGDMTCRAATSGGTCSGAAPTGAQLAYDNEGRLASWQDAASSPPATDGFLYDGQGNRVAQQTTQNGVTSSTVYVDGLEEVTTSGSATTTTTYYYAGRQRIAVAVNGVFSYIGLDRLGSAEVALDSGGHATASQLYGPYGQVRYQSGAMPGTYGFTGQRADAMTGLNYYGARYYDPLAGQFTSADTDAGGGLNRYAYVGGNPETAIDPSGHRFACPDPNSSCSSGPPVHQNQGPSGSGGSRQSMDQVPCDVFCQLGVRRVNVFVLAKGGAIRLPMCQMGSLGGIDCSLFTDYGSTVISYARQAGIDPRLLMAVLVNESGAHLKEIPHSATAEWFRLTIFKGALGIANMHPDTFDQAKAYMKHINLGYLVGKRTWADLAFDPNFDIMMAAYKLAQLKGELLTQNPAWKAHLTLDQLVAMGYNSGDGNMLAYSRGVVPSDSHVAWYGDQVGQMTSYAPFVPDGGASGTGGAP